ncbi:hypothetical protein [Sorangium sp. So ce406]|uniref:hypothetical protein n=1 Tax=Sorangium sp. So ce406 TaxID=3133311 RepID=UPI003F5B004D
MAAPLDGPFLRQLLVQLDPGEAAAIALAIERSASLLLIDEVDGRKVGRRPGLRMTGTLVVLLEGKRQGTLARSDRGWTRSVVKVSTSAALKQHVLAAAGEA